MRPLSVFCFTLGTSILGAFPLSAQLPASASSVLSQSSSNCYAGIFSSDLIIAEISDELVTGPARLKLENCQKRDG